MLDPIVKGCDWVGQIELTPSDGQTEADVVTDLTDATVSAKLTDRDGVLVLASTFAVVGSAPLRLIVISFTDTQTATLAARRHYWDIRVTTDAGDVLPVREGPIRVLAFPGAD